MLLLLVLLYTWRILWLPADHALTGVDVRAQFISWFDFTRHEIFQGRLPLWDPFSASGYPFIHNPQVGFFYPVTWLAILLPGHVGISLYVVFHLWLAGVGMLLYVRFMNGRWFAAILAALAFTFSYYFGIRMAAGHLAIIASNAWFPLLLLATAWSVRSGKTRFAILPGIVWALAILAGYPTSLIYSGIGWLLFAAYLAILNKYKSWRTILIHLIIANAIGFGLAAARFGPTLQFALLSARAAQPTTEFVSSYSLPPERLLTLLAPEIFGSPFSRLGLIGPMEDFWEFTYHAGAILLAGVALSLYRPSRLTLFYLAFITVAVFIALGHHTGFYELLYTVAPPVRLERAPARAMFLVIFALCALLAEVITQWERLPERERLQRLSRYGRILSAVLAGFVLLMLMLVVIYPLRTPSPVTQNWLRHYLTHAVTGMALFFAGGLLLIAYLRTPVLKMRRRYNLAFGLVLFVLVDAFGFGYKYFNRRPVTTQPLWFEAQGLAAGIEGRFLTWQPPYVNDAARVRVPIVGDYNPLTIQPYMQLLAKARETPDRVYDILAVTHILAWQEWPLAKDNLTLVHQSASGDIYGRSSALPLARLVAGALVIADDSAALALLQQPAFNPGERVILSEEPDCLLPDKPGGIAAEAKIVSRRPGYWLINTQSEQASMLVVSETAYPGWAVTIDGEPARWQVAYTALRAVCVPAGIHTIVWRFDPPVVKGGMAVSLATLLLVLVVMADNLLGTSLVNRPVLQRTYSESRSLTDMLTDGDFIVLNALYDYAPGNSLLLEEHAAIRALLADPHFHLTTSQYGLLLFSQKDPDLLAQVGPLSPDSLPATLFHCAQSIALVDFQLQQLEHGTFRVRYDWLALQPPDKHSPLVAVTWLQGLPHMPLPHLPTTALLPTTSWQLGQIIREELDRVVPDNVSPGGYALRVAWCDSESVYAYATDDRSQIGRAHV